MCDSALFLIRDFIRSIQTYQDVLTILGILYGAKISVYLIWNIYKGLKTFIWPLFAPDIDLVKTYGSWAVITGATDGIGKEYARELARRKLNIILISRKMAKLIETSTEIENEFKVKTIVIEADFSEGNEIYQQISSQLNSKEIGILVNNVGFIIPPSEFITQTQKQICDYININVYPTLNMTRIILPQMLNRRKGAIINISSATAIHPLPLLNIYASTKKFVEFFSLALASETKNNGITIQTVVPSYISTKMVKFNRFLTKSNLLSPSPSTFVRSAVRTLGRSDYTTGYWTHGIQYLILNSIPTGLFMSASQIYHSFVTRN